MKKFLALLAFVALAVPTVSHGQVLGWQQLKWRTTITSSTTPTYASLYSGENTGNKYIDSTYAIASEITTATVASNTAGLQDTSASFTLPGWTIQNTWAGVDTAHGLAATTGISNTVGKGFLIPADTTFFCVLNYGPFLGTDQTTETGDSIYVYLDGSSDGQTWVNLIGVANGAGVAEAGTANSWSYVFSTSGTVRNSVNAAANLWAWPMFRVRVMQDIGDGSGGCCSQNFGKFQGKIGWFSGPGRQ
jgi:hypothetical protein